MSALNKNDDLFTEFLNKASLKQEVYSLGLSGLQLIRDAGNSLVKDYKKLSDPRAKEIPVYVDNIGEYEVRIRFAGDVALFLMHSNVFTFPDNHPVYQVPYIREDLRRSYFSVISVYNFLNDSFKYNRLNDFGNLIARIFINKDNHYFVESHHFGFHSFPLISSSVFEREFVDRLIKDVVRYIVDFDLHVPTLPYVEHITISNVVERNKQLPTSKRLGFRFKNELGE